MLEEYNKQLCTLKQLPCTGTIIIQKITLNVKKPHSSLLKKFGVLLNIKCISLEYHVLLLHNWSSSSKHVLDNVVWYSFKQSFCPTDLSWSMYCSICMGILLPSILLTWSLQFCLCFPTFHNTGSVLFHYFLIFCGPILYNLLYTSWTVCLVLWFWLHHFS